MCPLPARRSKNLVCLALFIGVVQSASPEGWWDFGDASASGLVPDKSGHGNTGQLAPGGATTVSLGVSNQSAARLFGNVSTGFEVKHNLKINELTFVFWINYWYVRIGIEEIDAALTSNTAPVETSYAH